MNDSQPVFAGIIEIIENGIIAETWCAGELIISTTQISRLYNVNPATAIKAVSRLAGDGILNKRPGIGMCVARGARDKLLERRREAFLGTSLDTFLEEAKRLNISAKELINLIKERTKHD